MQQENLLSFLDAIEHLKTTKRTGWLRNGIPDAESISDHMYRMGIMAYMTLPENMFLDDKEVRWDRTRCIKMALVHDLAECIVGDITPDDPVDKQTKNRMEADAMNRLQNMLTASSPEMAFEAKELWNEYEEHKSVESIIVHDLDKLEMVVQADQYERRHGKQLDSFFASTQGFFRTKYARSLDAHIRTQRQDRLTKMR